MGVSLGKPTVAMLVKQAPLQKMVRSMHAGFSALTTGLLHWLTGPYVHALEYTPATQRLRIRTLSVLCQAVHTDVHLREVHAQIVPCSAPGPCQCCASLSACECALACSRRSRVMSLRLPTALRAL